MIGCAIRSLSETEAVTKTAMGMCCRRAEWLQERKWWWLRTHPRAVPTTRWFQQKRRVILQERGIESSYFEIESTNNRARESPLRALRSRAYASFAAAPWQEQTRPRRFSATPLRWSPTSGAFSGRTAVFHVDQPGGNWAISVQGGMDVEAQQANRYLLDAGMRCSVGAERGARDRRVRQAGPARQAHHRLSALLHRGLVRRRHQRQAALEEAPAGGLDRAVPGRTAGRHHR